MLKTVIEAFDKTSIKLDPKSAQFINTCLVKEYLNEYNGSHTG
jgi:type I restriction enzyme R subunit